MVAFFIYIAFMFSTPTIPTDSLYKFLFVGGIVLMLAAPYFFIKNGTNYLTELDKSYRDLDKQALRLAGYKKELFNCGQRLKKIKLEVIDDSLLLKTKLGFTNIKNIGVRNIVRQNILDSLKYKEDEIAELQTKSSNDNPRIINNINLATSNYNFIKTSLIGLLITGSIMTFFGFFYWLFKIQLLQDKLLKLEVNVRMKELGINKNTTSKK